ncbi:hypothetical protein GCM10020216_101470 [Nonomuraea helvata]
MIDGTMDNEIDTQATDGDPAEVAELGRSIRRTGWDALPDWPRDAAGLETWPPPGHEVTISLTEQQGNLVVSALDAWAEIADQEHDAANPLCLPRRTRHLRLYSAVLLDAVATQDTITQLIAAIRRVARQVPDASALVAARCHAHDYTDPGHPITRPPSPPACSPPRTTVQWCAPWTEGKRRTAR